MWLLLQAEEPDDYVVATGETHSVKEFLKATFAHLDLDWKEYVESDPRYMRPTEVDQLLGDYSRIKDELGWEPKVSFQQLVEMMVDSDMRLAKAEQRAGMSPDMLRS